MNENNWVNLILVLDTHTLPELFSMNYEHFNYAGSQSFDYHAKQNNSRQQYHVQTHLPDLKKRHFRTILDSRLLLVNF